MPSLAKKQNLSSSFKMGKKQLSFKANEVEVEKYNNIAGDFSLNFSKEQGNKYGLLSFYFQDIGLRLGKYRLVGPANYIEKSGDVIAYVSYGNKKSGAGISSENESSATGELIITKIDKEKQTVEAEFEFTTNLVKVNKKGKTRSKEVKIKQGKIRANISGVGREFFLDDIETFDENEVFLSENRIDKTEDNEEELSSVQDSSVISYTINDKLYFCKDSDIRSERQFIASAVECEIAGTGANGETFTSYLRFAFSNEDLKNRSFLRFSNRTFFSILYNKHGNARLDYDQSFSDRNNGIEKMTIETGRSGFKVDGKLIILSYDPDTGHLEASFSFDQELEFTNISTDGLVKGPYRRNLRIENGRLSVDL